jgi:hypothetical protein
MSLYFRQIPGLGPMTVADGMYGNFAGRDASRGMAMQSFDEGLSNFISMSFHPVHHIHVV